MNLPWPPMKNVNVEIGRDGLLHVRSRAVGEMYWPEPEDALGGGIFRTCDLAELRGRGDSACAAGPTTISMWPGEKFRRRSSNRRCGNTRPSPNAWSSACRAGTRIALTSSWRASTRVRRGTKDELKQFLLQKLPSWQVPREWWFRRTHAREINGAWRKDFLETARNWRQNFSG